VTVLTIYRGRRGHWMVHSDNRHIPESIRDMPAGDEYHGWPAERVRIAVEDCNPGCTVIVEGSRNGR
jgi:hypothetical protein